LLLLAATSAQAVPEPPLDQAALRAHIDYLADDALAGRKPGTDGGIKATYYIASQFHAAGLAPGMRDGAWYQPVALVERTPVSASHVWRAGGHVLTVKPDQMQLVSSDANISLKNAGVIFAGYGLDSAKQGFEDPAGVDVRGKVVLILSGRPDNVEDVPGLEVRRRAIAKAGAAAVIALTAARDPWDIIRDQLDRGRTTLAEESHAPLEGALAFEAWGVLLRASGNDPDLLASQAAKPGFRARVLDLTLDATAVTQVRRFESQNVIARLPGRDRSDQAVLILAHWDHLGICRPEGVVDRICNGAVDNASGVAMLIEVAKRLASGPHPRRSIYFVATTAEEIGLYGARILAENPPVPRNNIAAAINLDTVAIAPAGEPVAVIGHGRTRLDPVIEAAARAQGRDMDESDAANAFLNRQDGWELLKAGIPAVMLGGGYSDAARLAAFLAGDYHKPSDDLHHPIPLDGAAEDGALQVVLSRMLADPGILPLSRPR
jgi:hypothetical protein